MKTFRRQSGDNQDREQTQKIGPKYRLVCKKFNKIKKKKINKNKQKYIKNLFKKFYLKKFI